MDSKTPEENLSTVTAQSMCTPEKFIPQFCSLITARRGKMGILLNFLYSEENGNAAVIARMVLNTELASELRDLLTEVLNASAEPSATDAVVPSVDHGQS